MSTFTTLVLSIVLGSASLSWGAVRDPLAGSMARIKLAIKHGRSQNMPTAAVPALGITHTLRSNVSQAVTTSLDEHYPKSSATCNFVWKHRGSIGTAIAGFIVISMVSDAVQSLKKGYNDWWKTVTDIVGPPLKLAGAAAVAYVIYNYAPFTLAV